LPFIVVAVSDLFDNHTLKLARPSRTKSTSRLILSIVHQGFNALLHI